MAEATGKRRGHGEDSVYWDESKSRYVGAVSLGFSASGTRLRKKVSGWTKTEVRDKPRELYRQVDSGRRPRRRYTVGDARASLPFVPTMTVPFLPLSFCGPLA